MNQRMQDEMNRRGGSNSQQMPEGSVTIDPSVQKQQKNKGQNDDGDYVDYEEVK